MYTSVRVGTVGLWRRVMKCSQQLSSDADADGDADAGGLMDDGRWMVDGEWW